MLADDLLFDRRKVEELVADRQKGLVVVVCDFPEHQRDNERLKAESDVLKQRLSSEKARNSLLSGELSKSRDLAERITEGLESEQDNLDDSLVKLIGGLLRWREEPDGEEE